jgi:hypothetical protein
MALGHEIMTRTISVENPEVPPELRSFLKRCLERDPKEKWPDAEKARGQYVGVVTQVRRRLRYERHQENRIRGLEKRLQGRFAEINRRQLPADAVAQFVEYAR